MHRLGNERGSVVEYAVLAILAGLCALFVVGRFGGSLRGKVVDARGRVEELAAGEAPPGKGVGIAGQGVLGPERTGRLETEAGGQPAGVEVLGFRIGLRTAVSLAMLVVALGVWMVVRISRSLKKRPAAEERR